MLARPLLVLELVVLLVVLALQPPLEAVAVLEVVVAGVDLEVEELAVHVVELGVGERLVDVAQLVGVDGEVVVGDDAGDELAVEVVVRHVHRANAPVRVGVAVCTRAKLANCKTRKKL